MEIKDTIPIGAALCDDEDEGVRIAGVEGLSKCARVMAVAFLTKALEKQRWSELRLRIARAMEKLGKKNYSWHVERIRLDRATKSLVRLPEEGDQ